MQTPTLLHVTTTPSVAYIARVDDFDCGIMISASHNPYYDNGIKLIDCYGEKMPEEILLLVEDYIDGKLHVFDKDWPELPCPSGNTSAALWTMCPVATATWAI